ncbi:telomere-protecting terminal protein Tpg [Streptomyces sp. NPDC049879]|uniref:telomere-protecting terminal protein Tpg n=1 Tax=Streptomyces sp. NPDC049879 TaxID=3365598 RepID=UPI0037A2EFD8
MAEVRDGIETALQGVRTRPVPVSPAARMRVILRAERGSTAAVAARLGVTPRTVQRYLAGQIRRPSPRLADALAREAARSWQPGLRRRALRAAASAGLMVATRARFGFTSAVGSTDDPRLRQITEHLPGPAAEALLRAHEAGAGEAVLRELLAQGLGDAYFRAGGRAQGLDVALTDVDYVDVGLPPS